jgi:hypothetical protein
MTWESRGSQLREIRFFRNAAPKKNCSKTQRFRTFEPPSAQLISVIEMSVSSPISPPARSDPIAAVRHPDQGDKGMEIRNRSASSWGRSMTADCSGNSRARGLAAL